MSCDSSWLGLAEVSPATLQRLGAEPFDVVAISLGNERGGESPCDDGSDHELTTTLVQLVPGQSRQEQEDQEIRLHHVLYDCLMQAAEVLQTSRESEGFPNAMSIGPILPYPGMLCNSAAEEDIYPSYWRMERVTTSTTDISIRVELQCLHVDRDVCDAAAFEEELLLTVQSALQGRWIMTGTLLVLSNESDENILVVVIHSVNNSKERIAYRLGASDSFQITLVTKPPSSIKPADTEIVSEDARSCPGYETLMKAIVQLLSIQGASSPSGILLKGCAGVGKTRLLASLRDHLRGSAWTIHFVSLQEMLLQAAWSSEEALLKSLLPTRKHSYNTLWIVDDLDVLYMDEASDDFSGMDYERRLLLNCVLQAIDGLVETETNIICASRNSAKLHPSLLKAGRLEKVLEMIPPTQRQREVILLHLLQSVGYYDDLPCQQWSVLLASATAGCVAADLRRLAVDACTNALLEQKTPSWNDWKAAAQSCVPSQLALLDVTKPALYLNVDETVHDWLQVHSESWKGFCGYASLKKRVFRTVVAPWRRHLERGAPISSSSKAIAPPSGVLFHGPSGTGKTLAAECLGSSLGLPMVKVRAADVLDKWLGGSEEIIRAFFASARAASPCILLFDEIDSIANNRGTSDDSTDVMSRLLSTLLNEMDGVSSGLNDNVLVVACTNRLDSLDAALLRPGRLEEHIELLLPSLDDTSEILQQRFSRIPIDSDVDLDALATELVEKNVTAADLEGIARESVFRSLRRCSDAENCIVGKADITEAINVLRI